MAKAMKQVCFKLHCPHVSLMPQNSATEFISF